jgi:hypothetical protein
MNPRKRTHEDDSLLLTTERQELEHSLPSQPHTVSPKLSPRSRRPKERHKRASPQPETKPPERAFGKDPNCDPAPVAKRLRKSSLELQNTWFLDSWLRKTCRSNGAQQNGPDIIPTVEKAEGSEIAPPIEGTPPPKGPVPESQPASHQMSLQDGQIPAPDSAASVQNEKLNTSSLMYRGTLKMNGVVIDNFGTKIPREVQELVTTHIRKERKSPPLGTDEKARAIERIEEIWNDAEPTMSGILETSLFPFRVSGIKEGGDAIWSIKPLPRSCDYPYGLAAPKTDRHFGFRTSLHSDWTYEELAAADHSKVRPYSQPTRENLFPSFLIEIKSEVTNDTLYEAEGQLAAAGAHRVSSLMWILDQIDPSRTRSSSDALAFSAAVSQREVVAHVHYYNPEDEKFYMSYIDSFYFAKDAQGCCNHMKNVVEWMLEIQQPIVRDALNRLHPITKWWKKGRPASAIIDATGSFEDDQFSKSQRTL